MLIVLFSAWAVVRGSDVVSGELNRGTMEMLLAQPVSRRQVYWTPLVTTLCGLVALCLIIWTAMHLAVETSVVRQTRYPELRIPIWGQTIPLTFMSPISESSPMRAVVSSWSYWPGVVNLLALGVFLLGLTACVSAIDRYRWRTLGIVFGVYFVSGVLKLGAMSSPLLGWLQYLTFFSLYDSQVHIKLAEDGAGHYWSFWIAGDSAWAGLGPWGHNGLLLLGGAVMLYLGSIIFERRDLPAPM